MSETTGRHQGFAVLLIGICLMGLSAAGFWIVKGPGVPFVGWKEQWSVGIYRSDSPFDFSAQRR